jgi:FKBP-type peptidyl-prolyl cis-trans isomerase FkpA
MKFVKILLLLIITSGSAINSKATNLSDSLNLENFLTSKNIKAEKTREGIFFNIDTEGSGEMPKHGDYVKLAYVGKLLDGKAFDESPKNEGFVFQVGYRQVIQGWDIVIPKLKVGTKATLFIPAEYGYGNSGIGTAIPPNASLVYEVEIQEILSAKAYDAYMHELEDKERREFHKKVAEQFEKDKKLIQEYAVAHKQKIQRLPSGMSYLMTKNPKGEKIKEGKTVTINYEGYFLDDKVFDSTKDRTPFTFQTGEGKVIEGLEEGLMQFTKGSEGLLPSKMAYGGTPLEDDKVNIPAHSTLIFKVQVVDVK